MIAPRAARAGVDQWQEAIDQGLEMGEAPVLDGGVAPAPLDSAGLLLATAELAHRRRDATNLLLATGGATAWWLVLLLRPPAADETAPALRVAYTAPDPATHQAALTAWDRRLSPHRARPADLPVALQPPYTPEEHSAVAAGLETLPFALAAETTAPRDGWVAWAAVVVALVLLLLAIIV